MQLETTRFGLLDIPPEEIIEFPAGIPGFEDATRFVTIEDPGSSPFIWVQSLSKPDLAFLAIDPGLVAKDYSPELSGEGRQTLQLKPETAVEVLAIVTVPEDPRLMTANLRAPILINRVARVGRQEVGIQGKYPLRQKLIPDEASAGDEATAGR